MYDFVSQAIINHVFAYLQGKAVNKDKFISKMFLRGDSVILVLRNPLATAAGKWMYFLIKIL